MAGNNMKMLEKLLLCLAICLVMFLLFPCVWIPIVMIFMSMYLVIRFYELSVSNDSSYFDFWVGGMDIFVTIILIGSILIVLGWGILVILVEKVKVLKHLHILQHDLYQWTRFFFFVSISTSCILLPRFLLLLYRYCFNPTTRDLIRLADVSVAAIECAIFICFEPLLLKQLRSNHHKSSHHWGRVVHVLAFSLLWAAIISLITRFVVYILQNIEWLVRIECLRKHEWVLHKIEWFRKSKRIVYYAKGLRKSVYFLIISTLYLSVWVSHHKPHHLREHHRDMLDNVTWTLVCFVIASFFRLVRKGIVLSWQACAVYEKFRNKIMQAGLQLYYLSLLSETLDSNTSTENFCYGIPLRQELSHYLLKKISSPLSLRSTRTHSKKRRQKLSQDLLFNNNEDADVITTYELKRMAKYFRHIDEAAPPNKKKIIEGVFKTLKDPDESSGAKEIVDVMKLPITLHSDGVDDRETIKRKLDLAESSCIQKITRWVEKADNNCRELGNILHGVKEIASYLDRLLMIFSLALVILCWLFLTKIASTKLLILILSPIAALSLMFGETYKSVFQGLAFTFFMQLFHVGDLCVIDKTKLGVKQIGIWKTTFIKMDTDEPVTYQNSILATKVITKYTGSLDLNDAVNYSIPITKWRQNTLSHLTSEMNQYIEESAEFEKHPRGVLVKEVGEYVTVAIHFKHKAGLLDMMHSECHKKQFRARAELLKTAKKVVDGN